MVLPAQRFLEHEEHMRAILECVPVEPIRQTIASRWSSLVSPPPTPGPAEWRGSLLRHKESCCPTKNRPVAT